jgi:23S rRNA (cytosine1962-C5)-methyltransferase
MKTQRSFPKCIITQKGTRWVEGGHPWIYEAEVLSEEESAENGALVDAVSEKGKYLGTGFLSRRSKIRIRLVSRNANDRFDEAFWRRRIQYAWNYRKTVMGEDCTACRVIFGEADAFPGLTVDRFNDLLVAQTLSVGIERIKPMLFPLIVEVLNADGAGIKGLYERNDVAIRALEGLEQGKGWFALPGMEPPQSPVTTITENGIVYSVDVENGQKTGFFLDQKYNRLAVRRIAKDRNVLDCFTHTGSFALNAAAGGAAHVTAVDISETAIEMAKANAERNGLSDRMDFVTADVFDLLTQMLADGKKPYDLIILDPPAFTKSRKTVNSAERGYREINSAALKLLPVGGYLATASCSHFMPTELFERMLERAAFDAGVQLRQIEQRQQAPDHPILWNVPETDYLKFYLFQVVRN